jgi:hydrogenase nickel incorporation protein HypA/HybF
MHELPVAESILDVVLRHAESVNVHAVVSSSLKIGDLSDLEDEWIPRYFDCLSKGTLAEGARLMIELVPMMFQCVSCNSTYTVDIHSDDDMQFLKCGYQGGEHVSGREYHINNMEVK